MDDGNQHQQKAQSWSAVTPQVAIGLILRHANLVSPEVAIGMTEIATAYHLPEGLIRSLGVPEQ